MMTCRKMTAKSPYSDIFDPIFNLILGVNDKLDSIIQFKIIIWSVKNGAKHANLLILKIMLQSKLSSFFEETYDTRLHVYGHQTFDGFWCLQSPLAFDPS